ncbi:hypothetical protein HYT33_00685 [Candidatus Roizmanbacteria bacterium]|nr:hypothetical protein [Candidatus Roizmanbacteria bacterium]
MIVHQLKKLPKNTVEITVEIPNTVVSQEYDKAFEVLRESLEVEGFRKGKAPREVAEKHLSRDAVYQQLLRRLLPKIYEDIVKKEKLQPVVSPKIELLKAKEGEDWQIKITLAERPTVDLGDYKAALKNIKAKHKKADIWVPGKDPEKTKEKMDAEDKQKLLNEALTGLLTHAKVEISDLILEEELNTRLARLVDDVEKIGLTMEAYLKSKNTTMDELKARYTREIEEMHKLEFILHEIAEKEKIQVEQAELEKLLSAITDEKERKSAQQNAYFYASLLRKQKTLDFLLGL